MHTKHPPPGLYFLAGSCDCWLNLLPSSSICVKYSDMVTGALDPPACSDPPDARHQLQRQNDMHKSSKQHGSKCLFGRLRLDAAGMNPTTNYIYVLGYKRNRHFLSLSLPTFYVQASDERSQLGFLYYYWVQYTVLRVSLVTIIHCPRCIFRAFSKWPPLPSLPLTPY